MQLEIDLCQKFKDSKGTYGKRRLCEALRQQGYQIGRAKTRSLMKKHGLIAVVPKKKHYYPNAGDECMYAPNLLKRQFKPDSVGTHWCGDITYIKTHAGWCYLACIIDLGSKEIVGYATSKSPDSQLTIAALNNAIQNTNADTTQLMFHSDQGCQYSSKAFRKKLKSLKIMQSMSRRGNCWDNAIMERFFRNLKTEYLNRVTIINFDSANKLIDEYIRFYNFRRLNSAIGYLTPYQKGKLMRKVA